MAPPLASDVLQLVFSYLHEGHLYKLRCSGDKWMLHELGKPKSATFITAILPKCWPSYIGAETPLHQLSLSIAPKMPTIKYKNFLDLTRMPRTLRSLSLTLKNENLPFIVHDLSFCQAYKNAIATALPLLETLRIYADYAGGWWVVPDSITHLELSGSNMVSSNLPPKIRRLTLPFSDETANLSLPASLEWFDGGNLDTLSALPQLTHFSGRYSAKTKPKAMHAKFPALQSLVLYYTPLHISKVCSWLPPTLTSMNIEQSVPSEEYADLPRSLTHWTRGVSSTSFIYLDPKNVAALPRTLLDVRLFSNLDKETLPTDIIASLPPKLVEFYATQVAVDPSTFQFLPPTVTKLGIHNFKGGISHLKSLIELTLYGGTLSVNVAKSLPRSLVTLTLEEVAIRTKGHYKKPGDANYSRFSKSNPQFTALSHLPPLLSKIVISPHPDHEYYFKMPLEMLYHLPKSIEEIGMLYHHKTISMKTPTSTTSGSTPVTPTAVFSRLHRLKHLFFSAEQATPEEAEEMIQQLPRTIVALYVLSALPTAAWRLPNSTRYFSGVLAEYGVKKRAGIRAYEEYEKAFAPGTDVPRRPTMGCEVAYDDDMYY